MPKNTSTLFTLGQSSGRIACISLAVCFQIHNAVNASEQREEARPYYCSLKNLRPEQEEKCSQGIQASPERAKDKESTPQEIVDVKYPLQIKNIAVIDQGTGKPYQAALTAQSNRQFEVKPGQPENAIINIDSISVVEWGVGDFSKTTFSGGAAAASTIGWITGGLISVATGGIAAPLLLGLPFIFATSNQYQPDHRVGIKTLDSSGREQLTIIQLFSPQETKLFRSALQSGTGLKPGQRRSEAELTPLREKALVDAEQRLATIKLSLMKMNQRRPWCSTLDLSGKTGDTASYSKTLASINELRVLLSKPPYVENASSASEEKWIAHLQQNPALGAWAKANPMAAEKLMRCPS